MVETLAGLLPAFLAALVEFVEAFTIVLAVGVSRGWRAALTGAVAAVVVLGGIVAAFGPTLLARVDERVLLVVIGVLLLLFGARWLRKAILRAAGLLALHDEAAAYEEESAALGGSRRRRFDWAGFAVSFKGTFLEGMEVAFLVLTLGATGPGYGPPALGAAAALLVVLGVGLAVRAPLTRVPENTLKFGVGAMLVTFGVYWTAEGLGVAWAGGAVALGCLLAVTLAAALVGVRLVRVGVSA